MSEWDEAVLKEFHDNGGTTQMFGRDMVVVHTIGARSGEVRPVSARAVRDGDDWIVTATAGGAPRDPAWAHNLRANPGVDLEVAAPVAGIEIVPVRAAEVAEPERTELYARFVAVQESFAHYQEKTARVFPVFRLARR